MKSFSLCRGIAARQKRPVDTSKLFKHPPLVVLNGFPEPGAAVASASAAAAGMGLTLAATTFQSMVRLN